MLQAGGVPYALRVRDALSLYAAFFRDPLSVEEALSLTGLTTLAGRGIRSLSGGERQRVSLAMAIIGRPELVFLDEPTVGMDATARRATWAMIRDFAARGTTVILTTHYLGEAEELAQRVAILHGGRIVAIDTPASLVRAEKHASFSFATAKPIDGRALERVLNEPVRAENGWTVVDAPPTPALVARIAEHLASRDVLLTGLRIGSASLEEAFLRLTNGEDLDG
jgi:ABC-2 type transport system ATP-binding protein